MNEINGILNVIKPIGMTSHDLVAYIRKLTGIKKVGHTGTLDPGAAGVLPICLGRATRAAEYITGGTKKYRAELKLGTVTNTGDSYGEVITSVNWTDTIGQNNFREKVEKVLKGFAGKMEQVPPMFSAVKVNGQRLYELARRGIDVERKPRTIEIYNVDLIDIFEDEGNVLFDVTCSKGTYIRVLCEDIGKALGCGAHMSFLIRTASSRFNLKDALTIEKIEGYVERGELQSAVMPVETVFTDMKSINIDDESDRKRIMNGAPVTMEVPDGEISEQNEAAVFFGRKFIGISRIRHEDKKMVIKMEKLFV